MQYNGQQNKNTNDDLRKTTQKAMYSVMRTPQNPGELRRTGRVNSSRSTSGTRLVFDKWYEHNANSVIQLIMY